jgi:hypothetical protein
VRCILHAAARRAWKPRRHHAHVTVCRDGGVPPRTRSASAPNVTDRRKWALRVHARPDQVRFTRFRGDDYSSVRMDGWMGAEGVARGLETSCHFF